MLQTRRVYFAGHQLGNGIYFTCCLRNTCTLQLNLKQALAWCSHSIHCFEKLKQIEEGTYRLKPFTRLYTSPASSTTTDRSSLDTLL
ncbi:hypothetical protein SUGI_0535850 [Cryptomeria japonica]|nr:hypothetical protein SUGI_0535850 [Cryptomeria japonica]